MKLPEIPSEVFSPLGPIPVSVEADLLTEEELFGEADLAQRSIRLDGTMTPARTWQTLWHEIGHVILLDSGMSNGLTPEAEEAIVTAFSTYLTAAMQAGFVRVAEQKDSP